MKIKGLGESAKKWAKRAGAAGAELRDGINNPRRPWKAATLAAKDAMEAGLAAAIARDAFSKGVEKAGDTKWRDNALKKGVARYPIGVSLATDEWAKGFGPHHAAIAGLEKPPKGPRGAPGNYAVVQLIGDTLHKIRTGE